MSSYEDYDDDEINNKIKKLNNYLDKIIGKSKSFEEQIESSKKLVNLDDYYCVNNFDDKELKSKYFKIKLADMSNKIDERFEEIFSHTPETLANKLINTTNKKNQIIFKNIEKGKDKLFEKDSFHNDWVI